MRRSLALWTVFLVAVATTAVLLLHACRLSLLSVGVAGAWNFCPAGPPGLSAEAGRAGDLQHTVAELESQLANKHLACAAIPKSPPPPFELPKEAGPPRVQQTAALKPPPPPPKPPEPKPDLPADRWAKGDLSILEGCWKLGRETQTTLEDGAGHREICGVRTGRICFGAGGAGERDMAVDCPQAGPYTCHAHVTASFPGDGTMRATQADSPCTLPNNTWIGRGASLACSRVDDTRALCRDGAGFDHEFRR